MSAPSASASVEVSASAATVYGWLTDLDVLATLAEETERMRWTSGRPGTVGAAFRGRNRNGRRRWSTTCTVTDAEPGRRFGFRVTAFGTPVARWVYELGPIGDGSCRVTESTWNDIPSWARLSSRLASGVRDRDATNQRHIEATLRRVQQRAEAT